MALAVYVGIKKTNKLYLKHIKKGKKMKKNKCNFCNDKGKIKDFYINNFNYKQALKQSYFVLIKCPYCELIRHKKH